MDMRYYAEYNGSNKIIAFGIGYDGVEITREEYEYLMDKHRRTQATITEVFKNEVSIESVDEDIREDVRVAVDKMKEAASDPDREISDSEALDIILGGETA